MNGSLALLRRLASPCTRNDYREATMRLLDAVRCHENDRTFRTLQLWHIAMHISSGLSARKTDYLKLITSKAFPLLAEHCRVNSHRLTQSESRTLMRALTRASMGDAGTDAKHLNSFSTQLVPLAIRRAVQQTSPARADSGGLRWMIPSTPM
jgi:hypothetical protein